jgi:heme oxygenase
MSTQRERVDLIEKRLLTTEAARRQAVFDGDRKLHNDLANLNREAIGEIAVNDLRSLVTRWMLRLGKQAEEVAE